tara:strand:- start:1378 stop:1755 length:378 start_codon:yes stop_codon:yes gene_type:complete
MECPREVFLRNLRTKKGIDVDTINPDHYDIDIREKIADLMYVVICNYISQTRNEETQYGIGKMEEAYFCTSDFDTTDDAEKWIEMNRDPDDLNLIVYIYDNLKKMESCQHKRSLLYLTNMLYFYL